MDIKNIRMISNMDVAGAIGRSGELLCRLPADMAHFKKTTQGKVVVSGRKNYESIPEKFRGFEDRKDRIVLTRDLAFNAPGWKVLHGPEQVLDYAHRHEDDEIWIIGGGEIFKIFLPFAARLVITHIHEVFDADTFFPEILPTEWEKREMFSREADGKNLYDFTVVEYARI